MTLPALELITRTFIEVMFGTVLRSLSLAALCGCAAWLLRSRTAALRFSLWRWTLLALLALPLLNAVTPPLPKASRVLSRVEIAFLSNGLAPVSTTRQPSPLHLQARRNAKYILALPAIYLLITVLLLARLAYNLTRLSRFASRSHSIADSIVRSLLNEVWLQSGAPSKPRLAASPDVTVPVTFNMGGPWILMPLSWTEWTELKLRAVLTHEMAHVKRGDSPTLLLASVATCLFWFHPLSWFLRRQLSALAEEACDEIVLANATTPRHYATFLVEFARDVRLSQGRRLVAESVAVVRTSRIQKRIEKLFQDAPCLQRRKNLFTTLSLAFFVPALYLTAAARLPRPTEQEPKQFVWINRDQVTSLGQEDAASLEADLQADPEDLDSRIKLLAYSGYNKQENSFVHQLLWFIDHHPEIETLPMADMVFRPRPITHKSEERIKTAWEQAIAEHADSPVVLFNAANFLEQTDPERALHLLREGKSLDQINNEKYDHSIAVIYAAAELAEMRPGSNIDNIRMSQASSAKLTQDLQASTDPVLLSDAGGLLVRSNPTPSNEEQDRRGLDLIRQAIELDPGNPKWTEALEYAEAEPQRRSNYKQLLRLRFE